jgi:hypothetical protein
MQPAQTSDLDTVNSANPDASGAELPENPESRSLSSLRRLELWSGRLAMFSITTMMAALILVS